MINLPDFDKAFDYENNFYLSCDSQRMAKLIAQYELFKISCAAEGAIVECGVFKGVSLVRFAHFRQICGLDDSKPIYGFDTFGLFPTPGYAPDNELFNRFIESAGDKSIGKDQLYEILKRKSVEKNVFLIEGDLRLTLPVFPGLKISFLNLDVDLYEPSKVILENLWPRLSKGGVLMLDDYGKFPGETLATDEYFKGIDVEIKRFDYSKTPAYIVKK